MPYAYVSRRGFLGGVGAAGLAVAGALGAPSATAVSSLPRTVLGPYPRAFAFRQTEVLAQLRTYADWEQAFLPLAGIMGKLLPEERTDTVTPRNIAYFTQFKSANRNKLAFLHYNGRGRLPQYRTGGWYAADWLYLEGTASTAPIGSADETVAVADTSPFSIAPDAFGHPTADLVITGRRADNTPDWSLTEHVVLTAIDAQSGTLTITRGAYGSTPVDFASGAYVAPHVMFGPWSAQDTRLWAYNLTTVAPRGPDGLSVAQRIAAEMTADFSANGPLAFVDGIQLDVFLVPSAGDRSRLDADGDGVADGAFAGGLDTYLAGQMDFTARLREALGSSRVVAVDGGDGQRPDAASVGGIEEEGFPRLDDPTLTAWSTELERLGYWVRAGVSPPLAYPLAKTARNPGDPISFSRCRLTLAAALITGAQFSFWDEPGGTSCDGLRTGAWAGIFQNTFTVWDELVAGTRATSGWLGSPTAGAVRLATRSPDLLTGAGRSMTPRWVRALVITGATAQRLTPGPYLQLAPNQADGFTVTFTVRMPATGDLVVVFDGTAPSDDGLPGTAGRMVSVSVAAHSSHSMQPFTLASKWTTVHNYLRGLPAGLATVTLAFEGTTAVQLRRFAAYAAPDLAYRTFQNGAVFVNPSAQPATFDVATLIPGATYARLTATPGQDGTTNDGTPIGSSLTLPAYDALVVQRI